ncbi:hypothetical protein K7X08_008891 [Anisodus acutangulus]|uniref:Uncharacterized protein n=1 Tax=Anisodus acutangulus TaxID=402998 RepID=A0A9Q1N266_9SOLA|nr:hypothetical protein K7X08_008891 [Anisodus acutangulus]
MRDLAMGIEDSEQEFIWVVREGKIEQENEEWLPEGFDERRKEKGLIIRGWAPQVLILDHKAIGAFVTHCGWNSTLEGISAGVPMVTWPVFAEQFFNEKLVTEVLRIGVGVGSVKWQKTCSEGVKKRSNSKDNKESDETFANTEVKVPTVPFHAEFSETKLCQKKETIEYHKDAMCMFLN